MTYTNAFYTNPENTMISVDISGITSFVPCVLGNSDYGRIQELVAAGELVIAPYTAPPPVPVTQISMRQCRLELLNRGLLDDVDTMLQQASREVQIEWEYASTVDRKSALVNEMAAVLGLTAEQVDAMFLSASLR